MIKATSTLKRDSESRGYTPTPEQRVYQDRVELPAGQQALLAMLRDLSRSRGYADCTVGYMATTLKCSRRWIKKLLNGYYYTRRGVSHPVPGLIARGLLSAMPVRRGPTRYAVIEPVDYGGQPGANDDPRVNARSPSNQKCVHPRGVNARPPYVLTLDSDGAQGVNAPELFERYYFYPDVAMHKGDWMEIDHRCCVAFTKFGRFTHITHNGLDREVMEVKRSSRGLHLKLGAIPDSDAPTRIIIPVKDILKTNFFRFRHANRRRRARSHR